MQLMKVYIGIDEDIRISIQKYIFILNFKGL